jgi:hypothetical protein
VYSPETQFKNCTALFSTCTSLYNDAHPLFLANYLFECAPLKPPDLDEFDEEVGSYVVDPGRPVSDFRKVWRPDDEDRGNHIWEEDWMIGFEEGLLTTFDDSWEAIIASQHENEKHIEDSSGLFTPSKPLKRNPLLFTDEESSGERDQSDSDDSVQLEKRGLLVANFWIRKNPFANFVRRLGRDKASKIGHLRIVYGPREKIHSYDTRDPGPSSITMMSEVCRVLLPGLKQVRVKRIGPENKRCADVCPFIFDNPDDYERSLSSLENQKDWMMSLDLDDGKINQDGLYPDLYKSLIWLSDACHEVSTYDIEGAPDSNTAQNSVQELRLEDWHCCDGDTPLPEEWFAEIMKRDGLKLVFEQKYPRPGTSGMVVF